MSEFDNVVKRRMNSLYGIFGDQHRRYTFRVDFRGSGRLYAASQRFGCYELLGKLIRLRVKYPLWYDGDLLIRDLQMKLWELYELPKLFDQFVESTICTRTK
jgi:hypothetical protein